MSDKAFIDTTIVTDVLLKGEASEAKAARSCLARYVKNEVPVYAIKEFALGPLKNVIFAHNKLVQTNSFADTIDACSSIMRRMPYKAKTALDIISKGFRTVVAARGVAIATVDDQRGLDRALADEIRLALKLKIYDAWDERRSVGTDVVRPLSCFAEVGPVEKRNRLEFSDTKCACADECCLAPEFRKRAGELKALEKAIDPKSARREDQKRLDALKILSRRGSKKFDENACRALGDAYFALAADIDADIMTTNKRDHEPLAAALGKKCVSP